ncbi:MAG: DUF4153 domain-containing protein [Lachnospiraceae bacterium]
MNNYLMKIREDLMKNRILLSDYRFSVGSAALLAVISAVFEILEYDFDLILPFDEAFPTRFLLFFCLLALFTETCFQRKPEWKRWGLLLSAVLAAADAFLIGLGEPDLLFGISGSLLRMRAREISEGALWLLPVLVVYLCHRRTEQPFERYLLKLSVRILEMLSVYLVLIIGTALVSAVFDRLLLGNNSSAVTVSMMLVSGIILVPGAILALHGEDEVPEHFLRILIRYVFCALTICTFAVIYLYMAGMLFAGEFPLEELFGVLSVFFCLGMPVCILSACWHREDGYSRLLSFLPYLFAPLILMQILSAGVHIRTGGLTPDWYTAVMLIVFEIGTLLIWRFRRHRLENLLLLLSALLVLTFFVPVLNRSRLSAIWQQTWLRTYYEDVMSGRQLSSEEYERMKNAYRYLEKLPGDRFAGKYRIDSDEFQARLREQDPQEIDLTQYERYRIRACGLAGTLDVSDYSTVCFLDMSDCYKINKEENVDFSAFRLSVRGSGEELVLDLRDFVEQCMRCIEEHPDADEEEQRAYMRAFYKIAVDPDTVLYINDFELTYKKGMKDGADYLECGIPGEVGAVLLRR